MNNRLVSRGLFHGPATRGYSVTLLVLLVAGVPLWGCGMKGPPLAPLIVVPVRVTELEIRRFGGEVHLGFTLPTRNRDGTEPADLVRVDVYAMTTQPRVQPDRSLDLEEFQEAATLVASIEVRPRDTPVALDPTGEAGDPLPGQGFPVDRTETLTATTLIPVDPWEDERDDTDDEDDAETPESPVRFPLMTPLLPGPLQREYVVVSVSGKGHESATERVAVPLMEPPAPPPAPTVTYTETVIEIVWELPPGARGTVQPSAISTAGTGGSASSAPSVPSTTTPADPASNTVSPTAGQPATPPPPAASPPAGQPTTPPPVASPPAGQPTTPPLAVTPATGQPATPPPPLLRSTPIVEWPPASRYDLYELVELEDGPAAQPSPVRLNMTPLTTPEYTDQRLEFAVARCYAVSTFDVVRGLDVRSRLSAETCVTFVDTFPPAAPTGLIAVGTDGAVGLIWQPNDEEDLAGYLVLRGVPPGETLQALTPAPVPENNYTDVTAEPGVVYVYAVRAVDSTTPSNISPLSNQYEAVAR